MSQNPKDLPALIAQAQSQGGIDPAAANLIVSNLTTSATALAAAQGTSPEKLGATEATIVAFVIDKSGSMTEATDAVVEAVNESIEAMAETKQAAVITLSLIAFNERVEVVLANQPVANKPKIGRADYQPSGQTALYDAVFDAITGAVAYEEQLLQAGLTTKVILCVFSDGADNSSHRASGTKIRDLVAKINRENWILAFVGFKTYEADRGTDYRLIAEGMGFLALLEINLTGGTYERRHTIRQTFRLVSQSVIRKSQTAIDPNAPAADFFRT